MNFIRSKPQEPLPMKGILLAFFFVWIAPVGLGLAVLVLAMPIGRLSADLGLGLWFLASLFVFSPLYSWIGWLIALPSVLLALRQGWFGWGVAFLIGGASGLIAGALAETEVALPFGMAALLTLRAVLGRILPLRSTV
jgi:hypothetical protein